MNNYFTCHTKFYYEFGITFYSKVQKVPALDGIMPYDYVVDYLIRTVVIVYSHVPLKVNSTYIICVGIFLCTGTDKYCCFYCIWMPQCTPW